MKCIEHLFLLGWIQNLLLVITLVELEDELCSYCIWLLAKDKGDSACIRPSKEEQYSYW